MDFGVETATLINGLTHLDQLPRERAEIADATRRIVAAMVQDPRIIVVKLADRLHNMRTLIHVPRARQEQVAAQTLDILSPLAHRLGLNIIGSELAELAFAALFPKRYEEINRLMTEHHPQWDGLRRQVTERLNLRLRASQINAEVLDRRPRPYAVHQTMLLQDRQFPEIVDQLSLRVLVDSVGDCYAALGVIHQTWRPATGRIKDYIATPRLGIYQSLKTTVTGPAGQPIEVQIRTQAMQRVAQYGMLTNWRHGHTPGVTTTASTAPTDHRTWLRQLADWRREVTDPSAFLDALRYEPPSEEIYVRTPDGNVTFLPAGSTPVDLAYTLNSDIGHTCIGARVNGKPVPPTAELRDQDIVEISTSTSDAAGPDHTWLGFVKTPRARAKIRQHLTDEQRENLVETGTKSIIATMQQRRLPLHLLTLDALTAIGRSLKLPDVSSLYAAIGETRISAQSVVERLLTTYGGEEDLTEDLTEASEPVRHNQD